MWPWSSQRLRNQPVAGAIWWWCLWSDHGQGSVSSSEKSSNLLPILGAAIKTNQQRTRVTSCGAISIETPSRQKGWHQIIIIIPIIISIILGLAFDFQIPMWLWEDITVVGRIIRILQNSASWFRVLPLLNSPPYLLLMELWWTATLHPFIQALALNRWVTVIVTSRKMLTVAEVMLNL